MKRGMTLVEVLVGGALMLLLLSTAVSVLLPGFRMSSRAAIRVDLQQKARMTMEKLVEDLQRGAPASVALQPTGVAVQRLDGFTPAGLQSWEPQVVLYFLRDGSVYRRLTTPTVPSPVRLTATEFAALSALRDGSERALTDSVETFSLLTPPPPDTQPFVVHLVLSRPVPGRTDPERFELRRTVAMRNQ